MKGIVVLTIFVIAAILMPKVQADARRLEELTTNLRDSFSGMSAKRNLWFNNYSALKQLIQTDEVQLGELLIVSKMAIPLIWNLYTTQVQAQKLILPQVVKSRPQVLPYHSSFAAFPSPSHPAVFHLEATLLLHEEENFQLEILRDGTEQIFFLSFSFAERRAVMGIRDRELQHIELVIMADDEFPIINILQPFRVNVQVVDDCIFASIWLANFNLEVPVPLPTKRSWCTKDYQLAQEFTINIVSKRAAATPAEQQQDSEEEEQEEAEASEESGEEESGEDEEALQPEVQSKIQLVELTVYGGLLTQ